MDAFEPGLLARLPAPPRKVAVLRASRLGDLLCATPALRALRAALPQAELTLITLPILRELAERLPAVDRVVEFPGFPGIAEQFFDARRAIRFFTEMQAEHLDLAVQMQGPGTYANPFTLLLGARQTAGFVADATWPARLNAALPVPRRGHEVSRLLALTTFLGAPSQGRRIEFPLRPDDRAEAGRLLDGAREPLIGLHPGAREAARRWPPEWLGQAAAALRARWGGTLVVLGGPDEPEREAAKAVAKAASAVSASAPPGGSVVMLAGRTSLPVLAAVIERLALLVANDSGPAHVAYALGTPAVIVFGSASPVRYGPPAPGPFRLVRMPAVGLRAPVDSGALREVAAITVEQVVAAAEELSG